MVGRLVVTYDKLRYADQIIHITCKDSIGIVVSSLSVMQETILFPVSLVQFNTIKLNLKLEYDLMIYSTNEV